MNSYTGRKVSTFKDRFSELCDSHPMNDSGIASALNVSRQTVCSWKAGTRSPKDLTIRAIAQYFGVGIAWLMGFDTEKAAEAKTPSKHLAESVSFIEEGLSKIPTSEAYLISKSINKMPKEQRQQALAILRAAFPKYFDEEK